MPNFTRASEADVRRGVQRVTRAAPVVDVVLGEGQPGLPEERRPADALDPVGHALPRAAVRLVGGEDLLHHLGHLRPARRVVRQTRGDQLVEGRADARVRVLAADPDRDLRELGVVYLHRRARWIAGAAAHALLLVNLERGL